MTRRLVVVERATRALPTDPESTWPATVRARIGGCVVVTWSLRENAVMLAVFLMLYLLGVKP